MSIQKKIIRSAIVDLLNWFELNQRDLPWRVHANPYTVWISEIMLQQTMAKAVIPHFTRWLGAYPDLESLAGSNENDVLKQWEGLGYYSRARNILKAARTVFAHHGGILPKSYETLITLPGIGDYTAGAILSIGYGLPYPAVDANVRRITQRIHVLHRWNRKSEELLKGYLGSIIPSEKPGHFNEALMELGQTVCVPSNPLCSQCPLQRICKAFQKGIQTEIPMRKRQSLTEKKTLILIVLKGTETWILKRTSGLLNGLWVFPGIPMPGPNLQNNPETPVGDPCIGMPGGGPPITSLPPEVSPLLTPLRGLASRTHHYTRFRDRLYPYVFNLASDGSSRSLYRLLGQGRWVALSELDSFPMPSVYRRVARDLLEIIESNA